VLAHHRSAVSEVVLAADPHMTVGLLPVSSVLGFDVVFFVLLHFRTPRLFAKIKGEAPEHLRLSQRCMGTSSHPTSS